MTKVENPDAIVAGASEGDSVDPLADTDFSIYEDVTPVPDEGDVDEEVSE